ncbi:MAG: type I secretion system permease/ATPase [Paracoccaceae bacterium]
MARKQKFDAQSGYRELRKAMFGKSGSFLSIGLFSFFTNLLMLTGPLFMLQVYDRVLGSQSEETLVALLILVAGLYTLMGVLDYARGRVAARIGAHFQTHLDGRVFSGTLQQTSAPNGSALRDLEAVQKLLSSPAPFSLIDIPWTPIFILAIFIFHPMLGFLALVGGILLIAIAIVNQLLTFRPVGNANLKSQASDAMADSLRAQGDVIRGMGMQSEALGRWQALRDTALVAQIKSSDMTGTFSTLSKTFRFFLQSAILALGAYLVLQGEVTAGAMIAASILMGRALAPIEQTIGQWPLILRARYGWHNLARFLAQVPAPVAPTKLPKPRAILVLEKIAAVPPESDIATLRMISFELAPGQALGIIGPSASGKSTLARILTGIWHPVSGSIRLDGATLDQYGQDLGQHVGYLPQDVVLFEASVAENIARLAQSPDPEAVVTAAKKAGAHEMILKLPDGYDTMLVGALGQLSGGQKQRIGLARAIYGDPVLLVLDEPNASLDAPGSDALNQAIRGFTAAGNAVIIMAHRPSGIAECDLLMVLQDGMVRAFGPRDEVLKKQVQNHNDITKAIAPEAAQ